MNGVENIVIIYVYILTFPVNQVNYPVTIIYNDNNLKKIQPWSAAKLTPFNCPQINK